MAGCLWFYSPGGYRGSLDDYVLVLVHEEDGGVLCTLPLVMKAERFHRSKTTNSKIDSFYAEVSNQWKGQADATGLCDYLLSSWLLLSDSVLYMLSLGYTSANIVMVTSFHILIVMVISLFPIPGGSGGAEYSFEMIFRSYITSNSKLVLAMILWRLLTYYLGCLPVWWRWSSGQTRSLKSRIYDFHEFSALGRVIRP